MRVGLPVGPFPSPLDGSPGRLAPRVFPLYRPFLDSRWSIILLHMDGFYSNFLPEKCKEVMISRGNSAASEGVPSTSLS